MNKTTDELYLDKHCYDKDISWNNTFAIIGVLDTCQRLRKKVCTLNRRLQRTRTENKRLRLENKRLQSELDDAMYSIFPN